MNNYYNFQIPIFQENYGEDWDDFKDIMEDNTDYVMDKTFQLYWLNDIDYMPVRAVEKVLTALRISFSMSETLAEKKEKLRNFLTIFRIKGTSELYLDYAEEIVGTRGEVYTGYNIGTWVWGTSRWANPSSASSSDIRWTSSKSGFYVFIDVKTTNDTLLDEIMALYRESYLLPAFNKIYLVDSSFNILRSV